MMFDLLPKVVVKEEPNAKTDNGCDPTPNGSDSPKLPSVAKKIDDEFGEAVVPRLLGKIQYNAPLFLDFSYQNTLLLFCGPLRLLAMWRILEMMHHDHRILKGL